MTLTVWLTCCTVRFCEISWLIVPIVSFQQGFIDPPTNRIWDNILSILEKVGTQQYPTIRLKEFPLSTNAMFGFLCIPATFLGHHHHTGTLTLNLTTLKECTRMTMKVLSTGHGTEIVVLLKSWKLHLTFFSFGKIPNVLIEWRRTSHSCLFHCLFHVSFQLLNILEMSWIIWSLSARLLSSTILIHMLISVHHWILAALYTVHMQDIQYPTFNISLCTTIVYIFQQNSNQAFF